MTPGGDPGAASDRQPIELVVVNDVPLAHIMQSVLAAEGIESFLYDTGFSGLLGGGYPGIRLMVASGDAAAARCVLELPEK